MLRLSGECMAFSDAGAHRECKGALKEIKSLNHKSDPLFFGMFGLLDAELSPGRYWRGPRSQKLECVWGVGGLSLIHI